MEKGVKVLLVDDERDFLEPMSFWLESKGYVTRTVTSGTAAIEAVKSGFPDIVFLDIFMPGLSGIETLAEIRKFDTDIPVIMLTAAVVKNIKDGYSMEELDKLGVSGFFKKKDSFEELSKLLDITLQLHKKSKGGE